MLYIIFIILLNFSYSQDFDTNQFRVNTVEDKFDFSYQFSLIGGYNFLNSRAEIPIIPLSTDCGIYETGKGNGINLGIEFGVNFFNDWFFNNIRLYYDGRPVTLNANTIGPEVLNQSNEYEVLKRNHTYTANTNYFGVDLGFTFKPMILLRDEFEIDYSKYLPIYFRIGFEASDPTFDGSFDNEQEIASPSGVRFPNGLITSTVESGEIQGGRTSSAINIEFGGELKITKQMYFMPFLSYRHELTNANKLYNWSNQVIRVGASLQFRVNEDRFKVKKLLEEQNKEIIKPEPEQIKVEEIAETKKEPDFLNNLEVQDVLITETVVTQSYPILPYLFFEENSSKIKSIYLQNKNLTEEQLPKNTLDIYYNLLNIIGNRLSNSKSNLYVNGIGDNTGNMTQDSALAFARANEVKNYFVNEWNIDGNRIITEINKNQDALTSAIYQEGKDENRRVELSSDDISLFTPVVHRKFLEYTAPDYAFEYKLDLKNYEDISFIKATILSDKFEYSYTLIGNIKDNSFVFDIKKVDLEKIIKNDDKIRILVEINGKDRSIQKIEKNIKHYLVENKYEVGRLNLIVFDFDKYDLNEENKKVIRDFLPDAIKEKSKVKITGSTDRLGEQKYNFELSNKRAFSAANYINTIKSKVNYSDIKGIGSSNLLFDNSSPEGRFYCRTVLIEVNTPIEK